jgi:hypothetical protein
MPKAGRILDSILFRISEKYRLAQKITKLELRLQKTKKEIADLRFSYYLSGEAKKLDLRQLEGFGDIARQVISEQTTGMNYDRLYTIWQALQMAPPDLPIVEVGTYRGGSAKFICECQRYAGRSSPFYVCDTFAGHPRVDAAFDHERHLHPNFIDTSAELIAEYLAGYPELEVVVGDILETGRMGLFISMWTFIRQWNSAFASLPRDSASARQWLLTTMALLPALGLRQQWIILSPPIRDFDCFTYSLVRRFCSEPFRSNLNSGLFKRPSRRLELPHNMLKRSIGRSAFCQNLTGPLFGEEQRRAGGLRGGRLGKAGPTDKNALSSAQQW